MRSETRGKDETVATEFAYSIHYMQRTPFKIGWLAFTNALRKPDV